LENLITENNANEKFAVDISSDIIFKVEIFLILKLTNEKFIFLTGQFK